MTKRIALLAILLAALAALAVLAAAAAGPATLKLQRVTSLGVGPYPEYGMARTADGTLHLVYQTTSGSSVPTGLAARTISPAGTLGAEKTALQGWRPGRAGLVALSNGSLEAVFGAISPDTKQISSIWGITSSDGGSTWTAPVSVAVGGTAEAQAYGADMTAQPSGTSAVVTLPQAGNLIVQQGLSASATVATVTNGNDSSAVDVASAFDGAGTVVAGWQSLAGKGGDFMQAVAPNVGVAQLVPGQVHNQLVVAGRDNAAGIYAAYTPDNTHVRLLRYGGGSIAVGTAAGTTAETLGVATGPDGRIWVMWGNEQNVALTRSNKAVTRFEPIQRFANTSTTLYRLAGDGRLGPLDLLVDEIPHNDGQIPGTFYTRVLPVLSAKASSLAVKNKQKKVVAHKLTVTVTDAGDAVSGATVKIKGLTKTTSKGGVATLTLSGAAGGSVPVAVSAPGYRPLTTAAKL